LLWFFFLVVDREQRLGLNQPPPLAGCGFGSDALLARVGDATLADDGLAGSVRSATHAVAWDLRYDGGGSPLLLLPAGLYDRGFPKAKALVGQPRAVFAGSVTVDDVRQSIDGWVGSQNHNWGSRHTDRYAWGQVAGFDGAPDAFLECATAQVRVGPLWTPALTLVALRIGDETLALNGLGRALRARGRVDGLDWRFASADRGVAVEGRISAPAARFVGLTYRNPPGGTKICLNSKLATCELAVRRDGHAPLVLRTADRAAFEILDDRTRAGIPVVV
jgi:hypothetical protein